MGPTVYDCLVTNLPKRDTGMGYISVVDNERRHLPFSVKRVFYLYDIPGGKSRGAHAHMACHQLIVAASGAFDVHLDDGSVQREVHLGMPNIGLYIPPGIWASEQNFASGSICLILTSHEFDETDYIRSYEAFKNWRTISLLNPTDGQ
jgi:hypothetical protein